VDAPAARIWEMLVDSPNYLPRIWPMVKAVTIESGSQERVGAVRRCEVELDGKAGWTVERCVESTPQRRLAHSIECDSFGFSRFLRDFWFAFALEPTAGDRTIVRVETHYEPRNLAGRIMSAVAIRRRFRGIRETALANLRRLATDELRPA